MRNELKADLDERDYAKNPFDRAELRELFEGRDPRDFLNPKSPAFKAMGLTGKSLTADQAIELMEREPNLIKRPLTVAGGRIVAGFDRELLRKILKA